MSALEILPDLFFIQRGYLNGNHFVYRSDQPVLIDTAYLADFAETETLISALGVDLSRVRMIINSHCHCDHVGGNRIIQEKSGCEIALHPVGKHFIDTHDDWSTWWRYYAQEADFFQCTQTLEDGAVVCLGPHEFEVIHTPGHAADGIVLYNRKEEILISSDTLWEQDMAVITVRVEGSSALFDSLDALRRLEGLEVKTVYPGHGSPFSDMHGAIARTRKRLERFLGDPAGLGADLMKKIVVYTLMMKRRVAEDRFLSLLISTHWFVETVEHYFEGDYRGTYQKTVEELVERGIIIRSHGWMSTTVKP
jgi:hydroxyacylglutathione hydrolase